VVFILFSLVFFLLLLVSGGFSAIVVAEVVNLLSWLVHVESEYVYTTLTYGRQSTRCGVEIWILQLFCTDRVFKIRFYEESLWAHKVLTVHGWRNFLRNQRLK
jgi:hypothetical protein